MILCIDIGNTKIKTAVFKNNVLVEKYIFDNNNLFEGLKTVFKTFPQIKNTILCSVSTIDTTIYAFLENKSTVVFVTLKTRFPFTNDYETPSTLGVDRKVVIAGAVLQYPSQNCLIIDTGTCITYDFVDANKNYLGGAISPGISMRYKAMNQFTAKLPLLSTENPVSFIGKSTHQCLHSGVVNGVVHEIDGFIADYLAKYQHLTIILTGGDALFLAKRLKNTIFAHSNFLLESLHLLYQYNKK